MSELHAPPLLVAVAGRVGGNVGGSGNVGGAMGVLVSACVGGTCVSVGFAAWVCAAATSGRTVTVGVAGEQAAPATFRIDGQTYRCGQTFTRRVNFDSNTGGIRVVATGGSATYVQWTAVGTAPRVN